MYEPFFSLYHLDGQRKYLNKIELHQFLEASKRQPLFKRIFCQLLLYTGARIGEIHNLKITQIHFLNESIVVESLKKRKRGFFRPFPIPNFVMKDLKDYTEIDNPKRNMSKNIWHFSLRSASRYVKATMLEAGIDGVRASSRSLRHGYAVNYIQIVPIDTVRRWLGHSDIKTTSVYLNIVGEEERRYAEMGWIL